ncbi:hypothetical protein ACEF11_06525 [[Pasteurella] aerogenes]|nr:Transposase [[Pasteurella] aerogenes]
MKDAVNLAFYGLTCELKGEVEHQLYVPLTEQEEQLEALVVRRQLVDMRVAELNRLQQSHETQYHYITNIKVSLAMYLSTLLK